VRNFGFHHNKKKKGKKENKNVKVGTMDTDTKECRSIRDGSFPVTPVLCTTHMRSQLLGRVSGVAVSQANKQKNKTKKKEILSIESDGWNTQCWKRGSQNIREHHRNNIAWINLARPFSSTLEQVESLSSTETYFLLHPVPHKLKIPLFQFHFCPCSTQHQDFSVPVPLME